MENEPTTNGHHDIDVLFENIEPIVTMSAPAPALRDITRAVIDVTEHDLDEQRAEVWDAILDSPEANNIYCYGNALKWIPDDDDGCILDETTWDVLLSRCIVFYAKDQKGVAKKTYPHMRLVRATLKKPPRDIRSLTRLTRVPVFVGTGRLIETPGYDNETGILYSPDQNLVIPDHMTIDEARALIFDHLLVDFPFATSGDRANAVALLISYFVRDMLDITPMHLIDAAKWGTGKGLLAYLFHSIWGVRYSPKTMTHNDDETRKTIIASLMEHPESIVFDEAKTLRGGALQNVLTTEHISDRVLGISENISVPNQAIWIAMGNNVKVDGDMPRRVVPIRMVATCEDPSLRTDFVIPDIKAWTREHRGELIRACLTMIEYGLTQTRAGSTTRTNPIMGSFERYSIILGDILAGCGVPDFLSNLSRVRESDDIALWRSIVSIWYGKLGSQHCSASDIYDAIANEDVGIIWKSDDDKKKAISLGMMLKSRTESYYTINGNLSVQIKKIRDEHNRNKYYLATDAMPDGDAPADTDPDFEQAMAML